VAWPLAGSSNFQSSLPVSEVEGAKIVVYGCGSETDRRQCDRPAEVNGCPWTCGHIAFPVAHPKLSFRKEIDSGHRAQGGALQGGPPGERSKVRNMA